MPKSAKRTLILIKADPTEWDRAGRLQGTTDLPSNSPATAVPTEVGHLDLVLSGPDEASRDQAEAWAAATGAKAVVNDDLRELDLGLWTGLRSEELEARFERAGGQWLEDPSLVAPPEGETVASLWGRALPVLHRWVAKRRGPKRIAVILRPWAYGALRCRLESLPTTGCRSCCESSTEPLLFDVAADDPRLSAEATPELVTAVSSSSATDSSKAARGPSATAKPRPGAPRQHRPVPTTPPGQSAPPARATSSVA